jgi:phage I-like protein
MAAEGNSLKVERNAQGIPVAFEIFAPGPNVTNKGTFIFDDAAAEMVMAGYQDQGNALVVDYEHQTAANPPVEAPAAGRFELAVKDGGLWATGVKWTKRAAEYLAGKEYLFFSPWFDHDAEGRITNLRNLALTNFPATKNMPMLVTAKGDTTAKGSQMADAVIANTDGSTVAAAPGSDQDPIKAALAALMQALQAEEAVEPDAMKGLLKNALAAFGEDPKKDPKAAPTCAADPAAAPDGSKCAKCGEAMKDGACASCGALASGQVAAKAGADFAQVAQLTGKDQPSEIIGTVAAWKASHGQVAQLSAKVQKLEADAAIHVFDQMIADGRKAGKLTEADISGAFITQLRAAPGGHALLKAYLETAHVKIHTTELRAPQAAPAIIELTQDESDLAKRQGIDLKELVEFKARRAAERNG